MPSASDWPQRPGGFSRDPANEQKVPLASGPGPNSVFTGGWTRIQNDASFLILYGTNAPFTMQIQWSADGVTQDPDPFATITPQVRYALGLYSVISPQSTFFRPFYRMRITNGPSPQFFVVSDALLLSTVFPGYDISVDGPIPVLGLAKLGIGLNWVKSPSGWVPMPMPEVGLAKDSTLAAILAELAGKLEPGQSVNVGNFPAITPTVVAGGSFTRLNTAGTTVVKAGPGVLERVIVGRISAASVVLLTLYNGLTPAAPVMSVLQLGATAPGSSGVIAPSSLDYFATFSTGLTAVLSAAGADATLVWR